MQVLGIDTSTLVCSVAVVTPEKMLAEYNLHVKKTHSERLLPLIAEMLRAIGFAPGDLAGVAVAVGPGSFTGLRIGVVTARALGQALHLPLAGISTLAGLAAQFPHFPGLVSPILDARRNQVYNAVFRSGERPERVTADRAISLDELLQELAVHRKPVLFAGDGVPVHRDAITAALGDQACFLPSEAGLNRASTVARLGLDVLVAGHGLSYRELVPQYIRRTEAERKHQARCREGGVSGEYHD
ncbi:MAG: tRNA (adenosine(37)-N6)-threonylcarbamoyltransferase complex dimerization subunit type 1 TsaB [Clostridiales bacterium]|nr:tRNA (adenosine(37)-N6)-threonylcarbamoyltransferase complex dimerization subunit type 1 TsaB [Clostridiales bacterium]